jgi:hypothetical protein
VVPALQSDLLALNVVYALLAFLLLVLALATRWPWWVKALGVVLVSGFYIGAQQTFHAISGWPSDQALPQKFVFLSAVFDEPVPQQSHEGAIYIWVHPLENGKLVAMPRSLRLPYQKDLRGILEEGIKKARDGNTQLGSTHRTPGPQGSTWLRPAGRDEIEIKLSDVPRAQLPEK